MEWLGAIFFLCASAFFLLSLVSVWPAGSKISKFYLGILSLSSFIFFGEEISWGQSLFGFETPSWIGHHNVQKEVNIHNLFPSEGFFSIGGFSPNPLLLLFVVFCLVFFIVIPLVMNKKDDRILFFPLWPGFLFAVNFVFFLVFRIAMSFTPRATDHDFLIFRGGLNSLREIHETIFAFLFLVVAILIFSLIKKNKYISF